jgi:hypothetical protein
MEKGCLVAPEPIQVRGDQHLVVVPEHGCVHRRLVEAQLDAVGPEERAEVVEGGHHPSPHCASQALLAATGASTRELMARMGPASPDAALRYQHATRDRDVAIANALEQMVAQWPNGMRHGSAMTPVDRERASGGTPADLRLPESGRRESNSRSQLGKSLSAHHRGRARRNTPVRMRTRDTHGLSRTESDVEWLLNNEASRWCRQGSDQYEAWLEDGGAPETGLRRHEAARSAPHAWVCGVGRLMASWASRFSADRRGGADRARRRTVGRQAWPNGSPSQRPRPRRSHVQRRRRHAPGGVSPRRDVPLPHGAATCPAMGDAGTQPVGVRSYGTLVR